MLVILWPDCDLRYSNENDGVFFQLRISVAPIGRKHDAIPKHTTHMGQFMVDEGAELATSTRGWTPTQGSRRHFSIGGWRRQEESFVM